MLMSIPLYELSPARLRALAAPPSAVFMVPSIMLLLYQMMGLDHFVKDAD
jgi:hypothetical protein